MAKRLKIINSETVNERLELNYMWRVFYLPQGKYFYVHFNNGSHYKFIISNDGKYVYQTYYYHFLTYAEKKMIDIEAKKFGYYVKYLDWKPEE